MSSQPLADLSPVKRALLEVREMRARMDEMERARTEPVAIVGVGLRLPGGVASAEDYWRLLVNGTDAITEVPASRWDNASFHDPDPDAAGKIVTRFGGFIDRVDEFDAAFFGITPREAVSMDPQQRLLLEVAWEALEHAGQPPDRLSGTSAGVFVGLSSTDYLTTELKFTDLGEIDPYLATGGHPSVASGRLSYVLGLQGPSLTVDTACSSSLTALHLAVQSLRLGECQVALAGGVSLMLLPELSVNFSRAHMLAADGRCKTFDARADGYVRSEGCAVVVLKRLGDAVRNGDRIIAVINGTAVNQDGRSSGLTVPNGPAQEAVIREALKRARIAAADVDYVEAHGTGTALGDPVELRALGGVFAPGRGERNPLLVGSVKTNLGHLEAAAGIAGIVKVALALDRGVIPAHVHFQTPTPHVDWRALSLEVPAKATEWVRRGHPRTAGVSAFGFSGTNAHVVLSEAPAAPATVAPQRPVHLLTLSAKSTDALQAMAARVSTAIRHQPERLADLCHAMNSGRAHFSERAAMVVRSPQAACAALDEVAGTGTAASAVRGSVRGSRRPEIAFLFSGQGYEHAGMGRELFETQPVFRRTLERCDEILRPHMSVPLLSLMFGADQSRLHEPRFTQPVLFAFGFALAELWKSWGVEPAFVAGHSLGEDVAACVAGVFTLEQGLAMVAARARLMHDNLPEGAMAAVFASAAQVEQLLDAGAIDASIGAINGPQHVVISGAPHAVAAAVAACERAGLKVRAVPVPRACHSAAMDALLGDIEGLARGMTLSAPRVAIASTLTGRLAAAHDLSDPVYWRRHVRETVRFSDALQSLYDAGARIFVEIGPNGSLVSMGRRRLDCSDAAWLASLKHDGRDWENILTTLGELYVRGVAVDWRAVDAGGEYAAVEAPTYPFQRQRYWSEAVRPRRAGLAARSWSIRGERIVSPATSAVIYQSTIGVDEWPALADHRVDGAVRVPAALFLECAAAADECDGGVADFRVERGLTIESGSRRLQLLVDREARSFSIVTAGGDEGEPVWTTHATGRFTADAIDRTTRDLAAMLDRCANHQTGAEFYATLATKGLEMGPQFKVVTSVRSRDGEAVAEIRTPRNDANWRLHPAVVDGALQAVSAALPPDLRPVPFLFTGLAAFARFEVPAAGQLFAHVQLEPAGPGAQTIRARVSLLTGDGDVVGELTGVTFERVTDRGNAFGHPWLHELAWRPQPLHRSGRPDAATGRSSGRAIALAAPDVVASQQLDVYARSLAAVDGIAAAYIGKALRDLGAATISAPFTAAELQAAIGVQPKFTRLIERFLEILACVGIAARRGDRWAWLQELPTVASASGNAISDSELPELSITRACAAELAGVLRGTVDPLQLLFPGGSSAMAERVYRESPAARTFNGFIATAIASIVKDSSDRPLRILEIGAGTGATTAAVLPLLPVDRARYVFTDVSPMFLSEAEDKFASFPFVEYRTLDLERDVLPQGFAADEFDVVIAVNVLHATADLRATLSRVRQLLAPGGMLLISEATEARPWLDVTFGLTDGWWRSQDRDLRPGHPLLSRAQWAALLRDTGFDNVETQPETVHPVFATQSVILARPSVAVAAPAGSVLVFADRGGVADAIIGELRHRGAPTTIVPSDLDLTDRERVEEAVARAVADATTAIGHVLYLRALDADDHGGEVQYAASSTTAGVLHVAQALVRHSASSRLWIATANAIAVTEDDRPRHLSASAIWGFTRVFALEHPQTWGGIIDLAGHDSRSDASRVLDEMFRGDGEDQIALRGADRLVPRLVKKPAVDARKAAIQRDASYLVTGGFGRLGFALADWLIAQGATHLTLLSHRTPDAARQRHIDSLVARGASIDVCVADVADAAAMRRVFESFGKTRPELRGIIHAASAAGTARIADLDVAALNAMLAPKVAGTRVLADLAIGRPLDFFVLFSSTTGVLGSAFLAHYAAANAFLDAFAASRRAELPITSIQWGAWENIEIASVDVRDAMARGGLRLIPVTAGLQVLGRLLRAETPALMVVDADWVKLRQAFETLGRRPFLEAIALPDRPRRTAAHEGDATAILRRLSTARGHERRELLARHVLEQTAHALRLDAGLLDPTQGLFDLGMDSLMALDVRKRLESTLGLKLPTTLTFNYPTIDAIVGFVAERLEADRDTGGSSTHQPPPAAPSPQVAVPRPAAAPASAAGLDDLSEEQLADLLALRLEGLR